MADHGPRGASRTRYYFSDKTPTHQSIRDFNTPWAEGPANFQCAANMGGALCFKMSVNSCEIKLFLNIRTSFVPSCWGSLHSSRPMACKFLSVPEVGAKFFLFFFAVAMAFAMFLKVDCWVCWYQNLNSWVLSIHFESMFVPQKIIKSLSFV